MTNLPADRADLSGPTDEVAPDAHRARLDDLAASHPEGRLVLDGTEEARVDLRGAVLEGARYRAAHLPFTDLHGANLRGVHLAQADLRESALEGADMRGADLTEADLSGASLGEADLREALLEDARLEEASLRFADLREAVLEAAQAAGADFWGARLQGSDLSGLFARGAEFGEAQVSGARLAGADLREANLTDADFTGADLSGADLRGATLRGTGLKGADLSEARLEGVDLSQAILTGARFRGAVLDHTRFGFDQVGRVGEDREGALEAAGRAYLALERNFVELGDSAAATLAYLRRRRMQKHSALHAARAALGEGRPATALQQGLVYLGDTLVEWICDYGESLTRVFITLMLVYFGFTLIYGLIGGVERITSTGTGGTQLRVTRDPLDMAAFSLMAMSTSGSAAGMLQAANRGVAMLAGAQALIGIFLTGLLGFVAGHRIRR